MTEIPEHLRRRAEERAANLGLKKGEAARRAAGPPGPAIVPKPAKISEPPPSVDPGMALVDVIQVAATALDMDTGQGMKTVQAVALRLGAGGQFPFPTIVIPAEAINWAHLADMIKAAGEKATGLAAAAANVETPFIICGGSCGNKIYKHLIERGFCMSCLPVEETE